MNASPRASLRRSSRVPLQLPILVTSLEPGTDFSEVCETLVVNAHGCAMRSPVKLDTGVLLHFHSKDGREATAKVVSCQPLDSEMPGWRLGARLDRPENFWGLKTFPQDWSSSAQLAVPEASASNLAPKNYRPIRSAPERIEKIPASLKATLENLQKQVAEDRLRGLVAEATQPLMTELAQLREQMSALAQPKERSKFEVSLTHIPPELQSQIESRLRKELGPRVLDEARTQSAQVLESANTAIQKKTSESHTEFRQRISEDLQALEKHVQAVSANTVENLRDHMRRQMGEFHQHVVEAGNRLKLLSEELLEMQERALAEEHDVHFQKLEQLKEAVLSESSRLQAEVADLDSRIGKLDEAAHGLESGLDLRLSKLSSNTVSTARAQLEGTVESILEQLGTRSEQQLSQQVDQAAARLRNIQEETQSEASQMMHVQASRTLDDFEKTLDDLVHKSVERCGGVLAHGLQSVIENLGDHFRLELDGDAIRRHSPR